MMLLARLRTPASATAAAEVAAAMHALLGVNRSIANYGTSVSRRLIAAAAAVYTRHETMAAKVRIE